MTKDNIATARYNMSFDFGSFKKGQSYRYKYDNDKILVTTEESKEQDFYFSEFNALFYYEKNEGRQ